MIEEGKTIPYEQRVYRSLTKPCESVLYEKHIQQGGCPKCGGRRIAIAVGVTDDEAAFLREEGYEFDAAYWMDEATALEKRRVESEIR
jgi:hypothetical protein